MPLMTWGSNLTEKQLHPYYGVVSGVYYAQTGMPWLSADARKAVKTEWFWQPIRGQPRRVDTNELRKYANTIWVQSIVQTVLNQICSIPWGIIPAEGKEHEEVEEEAERIKEFLNNPNKNSECFNDIIRTWIKDVLEIDAGVIVKVFSLDSYDFEHLEPRSGAPLLKPLICPECMGQQKGDIKAFKEKAERILKSIEWAENKLPENVVNENFSKYDDKGRATAWEKYHVIKPDYSVPKQKALEVISFNSPTDANVSDTSCPYCNGTGMGRHLVEIYCQDGASFLKDVDRTGWTYGYWQYSYSIPAHPMWFNSDEIIYFMQTPRSMSVYGYSAVQSSLEVVKSLEYSVKHNMALFLDGAVPDGIVSVEDMSNEEMQRMRSAWENELKGQPHKILFVNKKTAFAPFAFKNREMQFIESQLEAWKQVIANFNMTPADLGIIKDVNRSTAGNQTEMTRRKAIRPLLKKIETLINSQLLPELGAQSVKFAYIIDDPVEQRNAAELSEIYLRNGLKTVNEIRIGMGLKPVEWGDENPVQAKMPLREFETGRDTEPKEGRPSEVEGSRRDRDKQRESGEPHTSKDYQYPFQSQVPFVTTLQNLSTPVPFALPRKGHINTQYPYNQMNNICPGCGEMPLEEVVPAPGSLNSDVWFRCGKCDRHYTRDELMGAIKIQEELHNKPDPFAQNGMQPVNPTMNTMTPNAPIPNLIPTAQDRNSLNVLNQKPFTPLSDVERIPISSRVEGPHVPIVNPYTGRKKKIKITDFDDFKSVVELWESKDFLKCPKYVRETETGWTFKYANYECFVSKDLVEEKDFAAKYLEGGINDGFNVSV